MQNKIDKYLADKMILLPDGEETLRYFSDSKKWISSDSKMSIPGGKTGFDESVNTETIQPFYIMQSPVISGLYNSVMYGYDFSAKENTPAVNVSWYNAVKFCNLLSELTGLSPCYQFGDGLDDVLCDWTQKGFRLASEAEWQYACRAGTDGYRYGELDNIAWYRENSRNHVHPVCEKIPNAWGLYDMLGNVWEWCWDLYDSERYGSYRVFRGGGWSDESRLCGATCRRRSIPSFQIDDLGFRIARTA